VAERLLATRGVTHGRLEIVTDEPAAPHSHARGRAHRHDHEHARARRRKR
jgi:hypothetical protein